ncbi:MAG: hypothetical protein N4A54_03430 [Peptostreptococcaceae bacterium]|nr:hypothetical protein [Peptostreptococcaceae bacterium]
MNIDFKIFFVTIFFVMLFTLQYTLNKIYVVLTEIRDYLKNNKLRG